VIGDRTYAHGIPTSVHIKTILFYTQGMEYTAPAWLEIIRQSLQFSSVGIFKQSMGAYSYLAPIGTK
jgi:hypothetical protein